MSHAASKQATHLTFMPAVALITISSGLRLLWITSGGFASGYFATPHGRAFSLAGASAIAAFLCATLVLRPAQARAAQLGAAVAGAADAQRATLAKELANIQRRYAAASAAAPAMLMPGAGGMAVARYLG